MSQNESESAPKFNMVLPFWAILITAFTSTAAYFGQREATNVAMAEIRGDMSAMKASIARIETDRYTGSDARRDFAWRDERATETQKRVAELELDMRRKR